LQPIFDGFGSGVTETVRELVGSTFYFSRDTFDAVRIPTSFVLESEPMTVTGRLQPRRSIDEKDRVVDEMFFAEFGKEHLGQCLCSRRKEPHV
jgi:hypothetical protein